MAYPSLICQRTASALAIFGQSAPTVTQFNQVHLVNPDETWIGTYTCDSALSGFLPSQTSLNPMTGDELAQLWLPLAGVLVAGISLKLVFRALNI